MKKALFSLSLCLLAFVCFSFTANDTDSTSTTSNDNMVISRILDAENLQFRQDGNATVFNLRFAPGDSMRFDCWDCRHLLKEEKDGYSDLKMSIVSDLSTQRLTREYFPSGWFEINTRDGRVSLVVEHGGSGEKKVLLSHLSLFRMSQASSFK